MPQVREIERQSRSSDYRFSALVLGVINSRAFRLQSVRPVEAPKQGVPLVTSASAK
jgi:hypothetical protein